MDLRKIKALDKKVQREVEQAIKKIYKSYNKEMNDLIANEIKKGQELASANGQCILFNKHGEDIGRGCSWTSEGRQQSLTYLSDLQYQNEFNGGFLIKMRIRGKKIL